MRRGLLILGSVLFAVDHFIFTRSDDPRVITIDARVDAHAIKVFEDARGRKPDKEELYALRRVWLDNEVLYRERLALQLDMHGLGFAGALKDIGLPHQHLPVALLTFNVGVELGQLLVVAIAYATYRTFASRPRFAVARAPALYAIGAVAAYWSISRIINIVG